MNVLLIYHSAWKKAGYLPEKYFKATGHDITVYHSENSPAWTNYSNRLHFYFPKGFPVSISSIEKKYKKKFDLIVEFDGPNIHHLSGFQSFDSPSILWSIDTHTDYKRNFHLYVQDDYDQIVTCHKNYTNYFKKTNCKWLPLACDNDFHRKMDVPKKYDVAFVGNLDPSVYPERTQFLEKLSKKFNVGMFNKVYGDDMVKILNQAKIAFNKSFNGDFNHRVFEVLSCGTMLMTDRAENGLQDVFEDGKHMAMYGHYEELSDKIAYFLSHDTEREKIAENGQKEVHAKHTYYHRAKALIELAKKSS